MVVSQQHHIWLEAALLRVRANVIVQRHLEAMEYLRATIFIYSMGCENKAATSSLPDLLIIWCLRVGARRTKLCNPSINHSVLVRLTCSPPISSCPTSDHGNGLQRVPSTCVQSTVLIGATYVESCVA